MNAKERNEHEALCPRCGSDAEWSYLDAEKTEVEIICPDCGRYQMTREEFDQVETENAEINESEPH